MTHPSNHSFSLAGQQLPSPGEHWVTCVQINPLHWVFWAMSIQQHLYDSASPYLKQVIAWEPCQEKLFDTDIMDIKHAGAGINHYHIICHHFDVSCPQHKGLDANATWCKSKVLEEPESVTPANVPTSTVTLEKKPPQIWSFSQSHANNTKILNICWCPVFLIHLLYPALPFSHFLLLLSSRCNTTLTQAMNGTKSQQVKAGRKSYFRPAINDSLTIKSDPCIQLMGWRGTL